MTGNNRTGTDSIRTFGCGCGCSGPGDIQYISIDGFNTGLKGLGDLFEEWRAAGKTPNDLSDLELLEAIRRHNYIPESKEDQYIRAVREKYEKTLT